MHSKQYPWRIAFLSWLCGLAAATPSPAQEKLPTTDAKTLFARANLVAWCIVPFDAKRRGPEERAAMMKKLGFAHFAYDWRDEHIPTFDAEIKALKKHGIELTAWWFPGSLDKNARTILNVLKRHNIKTQLWVTGGGGPVKSRHEQMERVKAEADRIRPIAEAAAKIGCTVALYNHGGWFGEPENQLAVIDHLKLPNVKIVYNLHHGHDHLARFPELLKQMLPHLVALNLNGMVKDGDRVGKKILPLGQGDLDLTLLKTIRDSGYRGPIGILGHTQDDAEQRLQDNLAGLDWLLPQLDGKKAGPRPVMRTYKPAPTPAANRTPGFLADGKAEYRSPPLTVDCQAKLFSKDRYNILAACDTKASSAHWEIFSLAGAGTLTAYLPGMKPDHVYSKAFLCDGQPHHVAMVYEPARVRLYVDGKEVADQAIQAVGKKIVPDRLGLGRLVENLIDCDGILDYVRITKGARDIKGLMKQPPEADADTLGLWRLDKRDGDRVPDLSPLKNPAKLAPLGSPVGQGPSSEIELDYWPADKRLKAILIDRSPSESYVAIKADTEGRLFVSGREGVFVFEPDDKGGYRPRQELFRFPPDSWVGGLELRGNDLYVLTAAALYVLPEARVKRDNIKAKRLVWGLPLDLHVSFHCLAWGPEGDLYFNHGDPLLTHGDFSRPDHWGHWTLFTQPAGTKVPFTGQGAVLRVKPDGSNLKVVAGGLRGCFGLCFDKHWSLFTNDNDHEGIPDKYTPGRLLHVTPHIDFGWPRGWMASKSPDRFDLIEPMISTPGRGVPVGMCYYDDDYLPEEYRNCLLEARWDRLAIYRYPLERRGASFSSKELPFLEGKVRARPIGVAVGRGGRVFATISYMAGNEGSPRYMSDLVMITRADDKPEHPFEAYDVTKASEKKLNEEFAQTSWDRSLQAHIEILRRGLPNIPVITVIRPLMNATPPRQRAILGALFTDPRPLPLADVVTLGKSQDTYLRQTATRLLAQRATLDQLIQLARSQDAEDRLVAVLAMGFRLTTPPHDDPPNEVPLSYREQSAFFSVKIRYGDDPQNEVDLRKLGPVGAFTFAEYWKAIKPSAEQQQLFDLLMDRLKDEDDAVKLQAAYWLSLVRDPRNEAAIIETVQKVQIGRLAKLPRTQVREVWHTSFIGMAADFLKRTEPIGPIDLEATYRNGKYTSRWQKLGPVAENTPLLPIAESGRSPSTHYVLFRIQSPKRQQGLLNLATGQAVEVWHNGRVVGKLNKSDSTKDRPIILDLQPGSNDVLLRLQGDGDIRINLHAEGRCAIELQEKLGFATLAKRLKEGVGKGETVAPEFLTVDWASEVKKGNVAEGRKLFGSLGCVKCHAITPDQTGGGGPSLFEAGKRFTVPYLVESILLPSKQIAEPFRGSIITTKAGQVLTGLIVQETDKEVELLLPDATRKTIAKADIDDRAFAKISPMPAGVVRTPAELRDMLAYLLSAKPLPP